MLKSKVFLVMGFLFSLLVSCSNIPGDSPQTALTTSYGGSDPRGDYVVVSIDSVNHTIIHKNLTKGEVNGPFSYTAETSMNNGFSLLNRAELSSSDIGEPDGGFVLFAEYPQTVVIYQLFRYTDSARTNNETIGNPQYAVYRQPTDKSDFYAHAYNWMKFYIDEISTNSDMEAGFAAFDDSSAYGRLYGAGYSHHEEIMSNGYQSSGIQNINRDNSMYVSNFTYYASEQANVMWSGSQGDFSNAISIVGTPSGTYVMDFGPNQGGGMGVTIPQSSVALADANGVYFAMLYEYNEITTSNAVNPMKIVVENNTLSVFDYESSTNGTPVFSDPLISLADTMGPVGELITNSFRIVSTNAGATSSIVRDAYLCRGGFSATNTGIVVLFLDPQARYMTFTSSMDEGTGTNVIRFGFAVKDPAYNE